MKYFEERYVVYLSFSWKTLGEKPKAELKDICKIKYEFVLNKFIEYFYMYLLIFHDK